MKETKYICIFHGKRESVAKIATRQIQNQAQELGLNAKIISVLFDSDTQKIRIIRNINFTNSFSEGQTSAYEHFLDCMENEKTKQTRIVLLVEANLGIDGGEAMSMKANQAIDSIHPAALTLFAGKQCETSMHAYIKPDDCLSCLICTDSKGIAQSTKFHFEKLNSLDVTEEANVTGNSASEKMYDTNGWEPGLGSIDDLTQLTGSLSSGTTSSPNTVIPCVASYLDNLNFLGTKEGELLTRIRVPGKMNNIHDWEPSLGSIEDLTQLAGDVSYLGSRIPNTLMHSVAPDFENLSLLGMQQEESGMESHVPGKIFNKKEEPWVVFHDNKSAIIDDGSKEAVVLQPEKIEIAPNGSSAGSSGSTSRGELCNRIFQLCPSSLFFRQPGHSVVPVVPSEHVAGL
jgi:hypothetical protein